MAFTTVDIYNRALQKVGVSSKVTSISENSPGARACNTCYDSLRLSLLRSYGWKFATKLVQLAPDGTAPVFGKAASFTLPADYVRLLPPYEESNFDSLDWVIQGGKLYTNTTNEIDLRYTADVTNAELMDPIFREALSALMASELCESLTQSNIKKADLRQDFKDVVGEAARANSFESVAATSPATSWDTVRNN